MTADNAPKPAAPGNGDAEELFRLSQMYCTGDGVEADKTKALELLTRAAELGNPSAIFSLGAMYYNEGGEQLVRKTTEEINKLFK